MSRQTYTPEGQTSRRKIKVMPSNHSTVRTAALTPDARAVSNWSPSHFITTIDPYQSLVSLNFTLPPSSPQYRSLRYFDVSLYLIDHSSVGLHSETRVQYLTIDKHNSTNATFEIAIPGTYHITLHPYELDQEGKCICPIDYHQCSCTLKQSKDFVIPDVGNRASWWGPYQNIEIININPPTSMTQQHTSVSNVTSLVIKMTNGHNKPWAPFQNFRVQLIKIKYTDDRNTSTIIPPINHTLITSISSINSSETVVNGIRYSRASSSLNDNDSARKNFSKKQIAVRTEHKRVEPGLDFIHIFEQVKPGTYYAEVTPLEPKHYCLCQMKHSRKCITCQPATSKLIDIPSYQLPKVPSYPNIQNVYDVTNGQHTLPNMVDNMGFGLSIPQLLITTLLPLCFLFLVTSIVILLLYHKYKRLWGRKEFLKKIVSGKTRPTDMAHYNKHLFVPLFDNKLPTQHSLHTPKLSQMPRPSILIVYANDDPRHAYLVDRFVDFLSTYCHTNVIYDKAEGHRIVDGRWEWVRRQLITCDKVLFIHSKGTALHYAHRLSLNSTPLLPHQGGERHSELLATTHYLIDATLDMYWAASRSNNATGTLSHNVPKCLDMLEMSRDKLLPCRFGHTESCHVIPFATTGYVYNLMDNIEELITAIHSLEPPALRQIIENDNYNDHRCSREINVEKFSTKSNFSQLFGFDAHTWSLKSNIGSQLLDATKVLSRVGRLSNSKLEIVTDLDVLESEELSTQRLIGDTESKLMLPTGDFFDILEDSMEEQSLTHHQDLAATVIEDTFVEQGVEPSPETPSKLPLLSLEFRDCDTVFLPYYSTTYEEV